MIIIMSIVNIQTKASMANVVMKTDNKGYKNDEVKMKLMVVLVIILVLLKMLKVIIILKNAAADFNTYFVYNNVGHDKVFMIR